MSDPTNLVQDDSFTEASVDTELTAHTPDVGTGWEKLLGDASKYMFASASADRCQVSSNAYGPFGYRIAGAVNSDDQMAEAVWKDSNLNNGNAFLCVGLQTDGGSDLIYYGVGLHPGTPEFRLFRYVSGTQTPLGTPAPGALDDRIRIRRVADDIDVLRWNGSSWDTIIGPVPESGSLITGGKPGLAWDLPGDRNVCGAFKAYDDGGVVYAYARPAADVTDAGWTDQSGGTNLAAAIDETTANEADYIQSAIGAAGAADDECEVTVDSVTDPSSSTGYGVSYDYGKRDIDGVAIVDVTVSLVQGTTVIASWSHHNVPVGPQIAQQSLSGAEADAITDHSDLRLRFKRRFAAFV